MTWALCSLEIMDTSLLFQFLPTGNNPLGYPTRPTLHTIIHVEGTIVVSLHHPLYANLTCNSQAVQCLYWNLFSELIADQDGRWPICRGWTTGSGIVGHSWNSNWVLIPEKVGIGERGDGKYSTNLDVPSKPSQLQLYFSHVCDMPSVQKTGPTIRILTRRSWPTRPATSQLCKCCMKDSNGSTLYLGCAR